MANARPGYSAWLQRLVVSIDGHIAAHHHESAEDSLLRRQRFAVAWVLAEQGVIVSQDVVDELVTVLRAVGILPVRTK